MTLRRVVDIDTIDEHHWTVRDQFATAAMQALLTSADWLVNDHQELAEKAYQVANAMMAERSKVGW